jgi:cell fate regulator YaaT (PSP1 superfamily)
MSEEILSSDACPEGKCNGEGCQGKGCEGGECEGRKCSYCSTCGSCGEGPRCKLHSYNWLADIPGGFADSDFVEVTFKNTRKGYYKNSTHIPLEIGDMVAVEATPGHDIGKVTLVGLLAERRMKADRSQRRGKNAEEEVKRVFRKARPGDLERYEEAKARENDTMIRSRKIAADLGLNMKIGDVEYQGDGNKAIFYYIADERVDFRQLIKVLAETFKIRIEMKQIGARQEAGRIGGIGPCGRPLCCSQWMTNFVSVATSAARYQDISLNPQKLAGQCAKLKCCLNFEVDTYVESAKKLPPKDVQLETADSTYYHFKTDVFKREITYSTDKSIAANLVTISADRAFEVIAQNREGVKPESLAVAKEGEHRSKTAYADVLGDGDLTRFDKKKKKRKPKSKDRDKDTPPADKPKDQAPREPRDAKKRPPKRRDNQSKEQGGESSEA